MIMTATMAIAVTVRMTMMGVVVVVVGMVVVMTTTAKDFFREFILPPGIDEEV